MKRRSNKDGFRARGQKRVALKKRGEARQKKGKKMKKGRKKIKKSEKNVKIEI